MRKLSVNIDHIATLRQARREPVPDPVQAAAFAELGGADGITVHLRRDRRHINERDVRLLKATIKTGLNLEMAATDEMLRIAQAVRPAQVTLVPELPDELTTQGGLDILRNRQRIARIAGALKRRGIRLSAFVEAASAHVEAARELGCDTVEINTDIYGRRGPRTLKGIENAARQAARLGLAVHAGHGIDYRNIVPLLAIPELGEFSIGFAIVARAVFVGLQRAVQDMKEIIMSADAIPNQGDSGHIRGESS